MKSVLVLATVILVVVSVLLVLFIGLGAGLITGAFTLVVMGAAWRSLPSARERRLIHEVVRKLDEGVKASDIQRWLEKDHRLTPQYAEFLLHRADYLVSARLRRKSHTNVRVTNSSTENRPNQVSPQDDDVSRAAPTRERAPLNLRMTTKKWWLVFALALLLMVAWWGLKTANGAVEHRWSLRERACSQNIWACDDAGWEQIRASIP